MPSNKPSNLLAALAVVPDKKPRGVRCGVQRILGQLSESERETVLTLIEEIRSERDLIGPAGATGKTGKWLATVLSENGYQISALVMQTHIRKACACGS